MFPRFLERPPPRVLTASRAQRLGRRAGNLNVQAQGLITQALIARHSGAMDTVAAKLAHDVPHLAAAPAARGGSAAKVPRQKRGESMMYLSF